jgi:hypothetical protein
MNFSEPVQQWLNAHAAFAGSPPPVCDPLGGRSLGPASGVLGDCFPFLNVCNYHGLFAGLSISGLPPERLQGLRLIKYQSKRGFRATDEVINWQSMSSDDWVKIDPDVYTPCKQAEPSRNLELTFTQEGGSFSTAGWQYSETVLSEKYLQHCWVSPDGIVIVAVTFLAVPEHQAPFLRPNFIDGLSAEIDPYCFFSDVPRVTFANGLHSLVILSAGTGTQWSAADEPEEGRTVITLAKTFIAGSDKDGYVKTLSNVPPNAEGHFSLASSGCYKFTPMYDLLDPASNTGTLSEAVLAIQNHCSACCQCEEYVEQYELLRKLCEQQAEYIGTYNEKFTEAKAARDKLAEVIAEAARLVRVREAVPEPEVILVETGDTVRQTIQYTFTLIYANIKDESRTFGGITAAVVTEKGAASLSDAVLQRIPEKSGLAIMRWNDTEIYLSSAKIPGKTVKGVRLTVTLDVTGAGTPAELLGKVSLDLQRQEAA